MSLQPRALVVGLGRMGNFHRRALQDLGYAVEAVDPDPATGAEYRTIAEAMLADPRPAPHPAFRKRAGTFEVAAIAVPREALMGAAYELSGTPMLVEKPFAPSAEEAAMLGGYLEARAEVCVGYVERFNPAVRALRDWQAGKSIISARFVRWSDRPCDDPAMDLLTHDVDLARYLGLNAGSANGSLWDRCEFDVRVDQPEKARRIEIVARGEPGEGAHRMTFDLMAHGTSPLHAQWHGFLMGHEDVARPADAVAAIRGAQELSRRVAA